MGQLFNAHTNEEHTQAVADFLPNGRIFGSKNSDNSNLRQYLRIFAPEMARFEQTYLELSCECDINQADVYLQNWERALGIPDDCFLGTGTIDERRRDVRVKLAGMNISTEQEFIDLAAEFGQTVTIEPLVADVFPPFDIPMTPSNDETAFIWVVRGPGLSSFVPPYDIPLDLPLQEPIIICLFNKLKPAFISIIFLNETEPTPDLSAAYSKAYSKAFNSKTFFC